LYTMFWKYVNEGEPMLKPLVYYDQEDIQTLYRTDEFIFGNHILVCPILEPNALGRRMYLPKGKWYNYWTSELVEGKRELWVATDYDQIPIFIKEGAIIPKYPVQQYVGEKEFEEITLDVYYTTGKEKTVLYEDAQDGYDYNKGRFSLRTFNLTGKEKELIIQLHKVGEFMTNYQKFKINLIGLPFKVTSIEIDNEKVPLETVSFDGVSSMIVDKFFTELHIVGE
jgi:alpha-glucosidase